MTPHSLETSDQSLEQSASSMNLPQIDGEPPCVLIVDDVRSNTMILADILNNAGAETIVATSGAEALKLAESRRPDIVLLDFYMPGLSGVETCQRIRQSDWGRATPVIFVTGASEKENIVRALSAGGVDYLTKPIEPQELLARIGVQLRLKQTELELENRNQQLLSTASKLEQTNSRLAQLSRVDGLTGILNRRTWDAEAEKEHRRAVRQQLTYCVAMVDIDYFKAYNDCYGHQSGDECLKSVASAIAQLLRDTDIVGRYGGEEFVVLLPNTTGAGGTEIAERIRDCIWNLRLNHEKSPVNRVTISIGVADSQYRDLEQTIHEADRLLYIAKRSGRNVVQGKPSSAPESTRNADHGQRPGQNVPPNQRALLISSDLELTTRLSNMLAPCDVTLDCQTPEAVLANKKLGLQDMVVLLDLRNSADMAERVVRSLRENAPTYSVPILGICARNTAETETAVRLGLDDAIDDFNSTALLLLRLRALAQLGVERKTLNYTYQLRGEQVRGLTTLVDVACRLAASRSFDELGDILLKGAIDVLAADHARMAIVGPEGAIKHTAQWDIKQVSSGASQPMEQFDPSILKKLEVGSFLVENPTPISIDSRIVMEPGHIPRLYARLESHGIVVGYLSVARQLDRREFSEQDMEFARLYVSLMSSALLEALNHEARDQAVGAFVRAMAMTAELHDMETANHVGRVARISDLLAIDLRDNGGRSEINDIFLRDLKLAAPLHDIGKLSIPGAILKKPGSLTLQETAIVRLHCELGAEIFSRLLQDDQCMSFARMASDVIMSHHERYDGSGYPKGLHAEDIPLAARIVAVADAYDAIISERVYRKARSHDEALAIVKRGSGAEFDPAVVAAFLRCESRIIAPAAGTNQP
ncbi:MAG: hypothetical protein AMXMBFR20_22640 [Planctomycetia bacterium]|nr:MAG: hypothetical protein B6D36_16855 [Planctomycetes bacterium UTPLA1]